jgi:hypothetical protein
VVLIEVDDWAGRRPAAGSGRLQLDERHLAVGERHPDLSLAQVDLDLTQRCRSEHISWHRHVNTYAVVMLDAEPPAGHVDDHSPQGTSSG